MKRFSMKHKDFENGELKFYEYNAPKWLKEGGRKGSTMDTRFFWNNVIMKLEVGETAHTDFREITRIV